MTGHARGVAVGPEFDKSMAVLTNCAAAISQIAQGLSAVVANAETAAAMFDPRVVAPVTTCVENVTQLAAGLDALYSQVSLSLSEIQNLAASSKLADTAATAGDARAGRPQARA